MRSCRFAFLLLVVAMFASPAAKGGLADPTLGGQPSFHLWSVPGVVNNGLGPVFACTNATSSSIRVGVQIFALAGGAALNAASATSLLLGPGATGTLGTQGMTGVTVNNLGVPVVHGGSARVLATATSGIICGAILVDPNTNPPASMTSLTIVSPNSQAVAASLSGYGTTALAGLLLVTGFSAAMMMRHRSVV